MKLLLFLMLLMVAVTFVMGMTTFAERLRTNGRRDEKVGLLLRF